jgi:hypothetical protein
MEVTAYLAVTQKTSGNKVFSKQVDFACKVNLNNNSWALGNMIMDLLVP